MELSNFVICFIWAASWLARLLAASAIEPTPADPVEFSFYSKRSRHLSNSDSRWYRHYVFGSSDQPAVIRHSHAVLYRFLWFLGSVIKQILSSRALVFFIFALGKPAACAAAITSWAPLPRNNSGILVLLLVTMVAAGIYTASARDSPYLDAEDTEELMRQMAARKRRRINPPSPSTSPSGTPPGTPSVSRSVSKKPDVHMKIDEELRATIDAFPLPAGHSMPRSAVIRSLLSYALDRATMWRSSCGWKRS
eukprot:TRINITY_DN22366_c0_g1_i1.p2 TRINITY_DN22366_c0_g1~~TRINITY_DN22366_c0_g1_i1.p2  ORF type:complete len:251 (-),score=9.67 TRINITY_DN22366_c0_g1_i1:1811-2563(-)